MPERIDPELMHVARDILDRLDLEPLKPRQRRFVLAYAGSGDPIKAVLEAGYQVTKPYQCKNTAWRLLQIREVKKNLDLLDYHLESELIATSAEVKQRLTGFIRDPDIDLKHAITACKLLLQANGDLDPRLKLEIEQRTHQVTEYRFVGPKSNFLKEIDDDIVESDEIPELLEST